MTTKIRVGIVGLGEIAQIMHLPSVSDSPDFELAAICDISPGLLDYIGNRYGVPNRYSDYQAMFADAELDAVVVCTLDHFEVAAAAIQAGLHVLVEKPVTFTVPEAERLIELRDAAGVIAMVGYMKLFDEGFEAFLTELDGHTAPRSGYAHNFAGRFDLHGELYSINRASDVDPQVLARGRADIHTKLEDWLGPDVAPYIDVYRFILGLGSHNLSAIRAAFGPVTQVLGVWQPDGNSVVANLEMERLPMLTFTLGVGSTVPDWDEWMSVFSTDGSCRVQFADPYFQQHPAVVESSSAAGKVAVTTRREVSSSSAFRREWAHFAACIRGEAEVKSELEGGLADLLVAEQLVRALARNPA